MVAQVRPAWLLAAAAVAGAALFVILRAPKQTGQALGGAAVDLVGGVVGGAVVGIGEAVGIPATECGKCNDAITEFNAAPWYEQAMLSFKVASYCPVSDYLKWAATGARPRC